MKRIFVFLFWILLPASAIAGTYELIKGQGVEVCEAYLINLNAFGYPMVCERRVDEKLSDFKKPEWTKPEADQVRALEFDMAKLVSRVLNRPEPKSEAEIQVRTEDDPGWPAKRRIARIDIDNDGAPETILKQEDGSCPNTRAFSVNIAVLTEDGKHYDLERSKYISADFSKRAAKLTKNAEPEKYRTAGFARRDFWGYTLYDTFLYRGDAYVDFWEMGKDFPDPKSARLHVFLHKNGKTQEICTYRFSK